MKHCTSCNQDLPLSEFNKNNKTKDKLQFYCRKCTNEMSLYYKNLKKPPKETRKCKNEECNNTFETRNKDKKFCCTKCANKVNNQLRAKDRDYRFKYEFNAKLKRKLQPKPNNNKRWTRKEDLILVEKKDEGLKFSEIGKILGRGSEACICRYKRFRVEFKIKRGVYENRS